MTRYQLAKLVYWAQTIRTRKRLQKIVVMLQAAGCPIEADYRLHHFGPYSDGVAHLADEMTQLGLLVEEESSNGLGSTYDYRLSDKAKQQLQEFEKTAEGRAQEAALAGFEPKFKA